MCNTEKGTAGGEYLSTHTGYIETYMWGGGGAIQNLKGSIVSKTPACTGSIPPGIFGNTEYPLKVYIL